MVQVSTNLIFKLALFSIPPYAFLWESFYLFLMQLYCLMHAKNWGMFFCR